MTPQKPEAETGAKPQAGDGRDARGRFAPGNPGGPGRRFAHMSDAFRKILLGSLTPGEVRRIAQVLMDNAREGDVDAAKLILQICLGEPVDMTALDGSEFDE